MNEYFVNEEQYQRVATFLARQAAKFNLSPDVMARMKPTPSELYVNALIDRKSTRLNSSHW